MGGGSSRKSLTAVIKDPLKFFLLLASLVFVLGSCSDGSSNGKDTKTQQPKGDNGNDSGDDTGDENPEPIETSCFEFDATDTGTINDYYDNEDDNTSNPACPRDVVIPQGVTSILAII